MYDVIVVGANVGGATAAIEACKGGASVAVIEKNPEPLNPPRCGEAVSQLALEAFALQRYVKNDVRQIRNVVGGKVRMIPLKYLGGAVLDRYRLEKDLRESIRKEGGELILGKRAVDVAKPSTVVLDDGSTVEGRVIIDASGIGAKIAHKAGFDTRLDPKDVGVCVSARVSGTFAFEEHTLELSIGKPYAPGGYAWFFPIDATTVNVGLGGRGGIAHNMDKKLAEYIASMVPETKEVTQYRSCLPLAIPMKHVVKDNVMVVGDAARVTSPISGAGIGNALASGREAGKVAAAYIAGKAPSLAAYQKALEPAMKELRRQYLLKDFALKTDRRFSFMVGTGVPFAAGLHRVLPKPVERFGLNAVEPILWLQSGKKL